ncbi:hypothetical protein [Paenibacillus sp. UNC499MF]|uniref:hypothetical protein n=1 Tax=Paenibacillus sp. UNC499MF TaxID=1502751 RepID=UPI0008A0582F|nr:hypothetical protein [Paenibacillus sp. UNC499MF]SEG55899.1 hypothetical protein SAMN02799616_03498 [Paenibacillus sp. UNC499MF]
MKTGRAALLIFLLLAACNGSGEVQVPREHSLAKSYLEDKGYRVLSYEGEVQSYELTKDVLKKLPGKIVWGLQSVDPDRYLGKMIRVQKFVVKGHPLSKGKVDVYVYENEGEPFGGTSFPQDQYGSAGSGWSLDGKTLEEVHSVSFPDWREAWQEKYGS